MRKKFIYSILTLTALSIFFGLNEANAAVSVQVGTPNVSFSISDYQPAPPNVYVQSDRGRPYYVERDRRVYMEKRKHGKHYKEKKHHKDNGHKNGHNKHDRHDD
jgi:hypothetical protein